MQAPLNLQTNPIAITSEINSIREEEDMLKMKLYLLHMRNVPVNRKLSTIGPFAAAAH